MLASSFRLDSLWNQNQQKSRTSKNTCCSTSAKDAPVGFGTATIPPEETSIALQEIAHASNPQPPWSPPPAPSQSQQRDHPLWPTWGLQSKSEFRIAKMYPIWKNNLRNMFQRWKNFAPHKGAQLHLQRDQRVRFETPRALGKGHFHFAGIADFSSQTPRLAWFKDTKTELIYIN